MITSKIMHDKVLNQLCDIYVKSPANFKADVTMRLKGTLVLGLQLASIAVNIGEIVLKIFAKAGINLARVFTWSVGLASSKVQGYDQKLATLSSNFKALDTCQQLVNNVGAVSLGIVLAWSSPRDNWEWQSKMGYSMDKLFVPPEPKLKEQKPKTESGEPKPAQAVAVYAAAAAVSAT